MGIFERSHYQAIAEEFSVYMRLCDDPEEIVGMANYLGMMFAKDNPNFKKEKFLKACGMEEG